MTGYMVSPLITVDYYPMGAKIQVSKATRTLAFATAIPRADGKVVVSQYDPNFNDPNLR